MAAPRQEGGWQHGGGDNGFRGNWNRGQGGDRPHSVVTTPTPMPRSSVTTPAPDRGFTGGHWSQSGVPQQPGRDGGRNPGNDNDHARSGTWMRDNSGNWNRGTNTPPVLRANPPHDGNPNWNRDNNGNWNRGTNPPHDVSRDWRRDSNGNWNRSYSSPPVLRGNPPRDAGRNFGDQHHFDGDRWANQQRWDRDWRHDHRYDWSSYRQYNRNIYRLPPYYAPYGWSYGYHSFGIGYYLDSLLFADNYWIVDPWTYRLPPAYGTLRWIRYYNDALLIDIRDGYVVDVIHDFFW
jgi:hypothetical protein